MKSLKRQAVYRHAIEDVWTALTDPRALAEWLMPTTPFELKIGEKFRFQFDPERLNPTGIVDCEILEIEPPRRLVWSFQNRAADDKTQAPPMRIEWLLTPLDGETRVELVQTYEKQPWSIIFAMGIGWRLYLRKFLPMALRNVDAGVFRPGAIPLAKRAYRASNLPNDIIV